MEPHKTSTTINNAAINPHNNVTTGTAAVTGNNPHTHSHSHSHPHEEKEGALSGIKQGLKHLKEKIVGEDERDRDIQIAAEKEAKHQDGKTGPE
ncbi:hypothetical protein K502DRAFT_326051 [Neoconidiobolus thromboides FSU 785]|nr:hypothetical protein K502DRAFT_326051 [Neoconidiobolus thromboides FSU 785]